MATILFPLRSNTTWFESPDAVDEFERRLKVMSILYDELAFENGRIATVGNDSGGFEIRPPLGAIDRSKLEFFRSGSEFNLQVELDGEWHSILGGEAGFRFEIDFYPILERAGLLNASWVKVFSMPSITEGRRRWVETAVETDLQDEDLLNLLPPSGFLRRKILEGLYSDAVLLGRNTWSISRMVGRLIEWQTRTRAGLFTHDPRSGVLERAFELGIPDFSGMTWDEIDRIRDSAPAQDLRRMIQVVVEDVKALVGDGASREEVERAISSRWNEEIGRELRSRVREGPGEVIRNAVLELVLNGIPGASLVFLGKSLSEAAEERSSWVALLAR